MERIKVVWLCHFSNDFVHEKLTLGYNWFVKVLCNILHKPLRTEVPEFAVWVTNGIKEFEKINEVELHIVSPYPHLKTSIQEFEANGIHYHFFHNEDELLMTKIYKHVFRPRFFKYRINRKSIFKIINLIQPDIVHLIGAENPYYSLGLLDVPDGIITIAQLQTLMNDPDFQSNYPIDSVSYNYRASIERMIICNSNYTGTTALKYRKIIRDRINSNVILLNTTLPLKESIVMDQGEKQYDFVYFAKNLSKAADLAVEAFGVAFQSNSNLTMDVIGSYDSVFKFQLDGIIKKYGVKEAVHFEGGIASHEDLLKQIRKSRFALLPLRIDLTSSTIREAMSNGLPVITTDTGELGTQRLNQIRQNVLISPIGDHQALASNMLKLVFDKELAETIRQNAYQTRFEAKSNKEVAYEYVRAYIACIDYCKKNNPIPVELTDV